VSFVSIDLTKVQHDLKKDKDKKRRLLKKKLVFLEIISRVLKFYDLKISWLSEDIGFFIC